MKRIRGMMFLRVTGTIAAVACLGVTARASEYRSPLAVAVSPDGKTLYASDKTALCVDGLPWDFMRDGIDNGKDVISLVNMPHTPPHNRRGTRPTPRQCMETGVLGSHFVAPEPADVDDLLAYMLSLAPEPNPNLPQFAEAARRGKVLFEGKADCATCHPGPYFTDKKTYDVGTGNPSEPDGRYDTPSLIEAYRTAPYYHAGRAATITEALTGHDPKQLHGKLKDLTPREIEDLIVYVLSL